MRKKHKNFFILVIICILMMTILSACNNNDKIKVPKVKENIYIYDMNNVLDDEVEENVNNILVKFEDITTNEIVVVSIESLNGLSIKTYANKLFNKLKIGKKDINNGILLIFSKEDDKARIEVGNGIDEIITNDIAGNLLDNYFVPYRENNNYNAAVEKTITAITKKLYEENDIKEKNTSKYNLFDYIIIFIAIIIIIFETMFIIIAKIKGLGNIVDHHSNSKYDNSSDFVYSSRFGHSSRHSSSSRFGGGCSGGSGASR